MHVICLGDLEMKMKKNIDPLMPSRGLFCVNINGGPIHTFLFKLMKLLLQAKGHREPKAATRPDGLVASSSLRSNGYCAYSRPQLSFIAGARVTNRPAGSVHSYKDKVSRE